MCKDGHKVEYEAKIALIWASLMAGSGAHMINEVTEGYFAPACHGTSLLLCWARHLLGPVNQFSRQKIGEASATPILASKAY